MRPRRITVSSYALGSKATVNVLVYDDLRHLRRAAGAYNDGGITEESDTLGVTQVSRYKANDELHEVIVRLARGHLGTQIVGHEIHHASTAWYGDHVGARITTAHHLNHHNEPFAHLFSDILAKLVDRLHELGYYDKDTDDG